jgi:hypothetical protein
VSAGVVVVVVAGVVAGVVTAGVSVVVVAGAVVAGALLVVVDGSVVVVVLVPLEVLLSALDALELEADVLVCEVALVGCVVFGCCLPRIALTPK